MEALSRTKPRFVKKDMLQKIGGVSFNGFQQPLLPDPAAQYQIMPSPSTSHNGNKADSIIGKMIQLRECMDVYAQRIREHVKLAPKISETVKGKLSLGARIIKVGGIEKVFKRNFNIREDEKLLKVSQCYLSTTSGPISGLLFISDNRVAFSSDRSIKLSSPTGKLLKLRYKVIIPLTKIRRAHEGENAAKPTQKYLQLVTEDNFEFWFMGFLNHRRTLKHLQQAIHDTR